MASVALLLAAPSGAKAQDGAFDVFIPIVKYVKAGDAESLSAWFADNLEVSIFSSENDVSRKQARQIFKDFFLTYTPRSFEITHTAGRSNMKYAVGKLSAGGQTMDMTIFVSYKNGGYRIQQIKIEKND